MGDTLRQEIKQTKPFASLEEEVFLGLLLTAQRANDPWAVYVKAQADLTLTQYNVLRILRGAWPKGLTCGEIAERMITRDPDITRLVDRLTRQELARRERDTGDRRLVRVCITKGGLAALRRLDRAADAMPRRLLGHLGKTRLRQLGELLAAVRSGLTTFP
jgi:DNA-binding MarR family transcriptional regulator